MPAVMADKRKLLPFQIESLRQIDEFKGRCLLALDMGLGKTLISLTWIKRKPLERLPALVICPAAVKHQWQKEAERLGIQSCVLSGQMAFEPEVRPAPLLIINYDVLPSWADWLAKQEHATIILDEVQLTKNLRAKRTRAVRKVVQGQDRNVHLLALSGTPLLNSPIELFPILNLLWPRYYSNFWSYAKKFSKPKRTPWGWDFRMARNVKTLHKQLKKLGLIRYRKADVLKDRLPPKIRQVIPCKLSSRREYKMASNDFLGWLRKTDPQRLRSAVKAQALVKLGYLLRLTGRLKINSVVSWIEKFLTYMPEDRKLCLFCVHKHVIDELAERTRHLTDCVIIDGRTSPSRRKKLVEKFQQDPNCRLCIGNVQAAGVGLDGLQQASSVVAVIELCWRPGDHLQLEDRLHRIGQQNTVWVYYLIAKGTIEDQLCEILQRKQKTITQVLDGKGWRRRKELELNLYDELLATLWHKAQELPDSN